MSSANEFLGVPLASASHRDVVNNAQLFMETLHKFHSSLGNTNFTIPVIDFKPLNLHLLYVEITKRGGFEQVTIEKRWKEVSKVFQFGKTMTNAAFMLKKHYLSLLHRYEVVYFRLGLDPVPIQADPVQIEGIVIDRHFENGYLVHVKSSNGIFSGVLYYDTPSAGSSSSAAEPQPSTAIVPYAVHNPSTTGASSSAVVPYAVPDLADNVVPAQTAVVPYAVPDLANNVVPAQTAVVPYAVPDLAENVVPAQTAVVPYAVPDLADNVVPQPATRKGQAARIRKQDPNYPKFSRTGYNFFFKEMHPELKDLYPKMPRELTSFLARAWNNLPGEQKMVYHDMEMRDRERFQKEMKEYKESRGQQS